MQKHAKTCKNYCSILQYIAVLWSWISWVYLGFKSVHYCSVMLIHDFAATRINMQYRAITCINYCGIVSMGLLGFKSVGNWRNQITTQFQLSTKTTQIQRDSNKNPTHFPFQHGSNKI